MIRQFKVLFGLAVVLFTGIASVAVWGALEWHHSGTESSMQATIGTLQATVGQLQEELKGTSPQVAAMQSRRSGDRAKLLSLYVQSRKIIDNLNATKLGSPERDLEVNFAESWIKSSDNWIENTFGEAAKQRFSEQKKLIGIGDQKFDAAYNGTLNRHDNLAILIETAAYDR